MVEKIKGRWTEEKQEKRNNVKETVIKWIYNWKREWKCLYEINK